MVKLICAFIFKISGWKFENNIPDDLRSFVLIGAPHTSNYDFIPAMALAYFLKRNSHFAIKKEWLRFPLGIFLKSMGAIGIDRVALKQTKSQSNTEVLAELFKANKELVLMIAPEGTRKANNVWKTGFYYTAQKASVPIVLAYADYKEKKVGVGPVLYPSDFEKDMQTIMSFYHAVEARIPEKFVLDHRFEDKSLK